MQDSLLARTERQLAELIQRHQRLQSEFAALQAREQQWMAEQNHLHHQQAQSQSRMESILRRLQHLERGSA